jgi:hypothetical protein
MSQRPSGHTRVNDDFYAEPPECLLALIDAFDWVRDGFHDPAAGTGGGTITAAERRGFHATGSDLVDRANGRFPVRDFFTDPTHRHNICCNPPFSKAVEFIEYGLTHLCEGGRIAVFCDLNFLSAQRRYPSEFECLLVLMRRPSCPPGALFQAGQIKRRNGSGNYGWFVFQRCGAHGSRRLLFAPP